MTDTESPLTRYEPLLNRWQSAGVLDANAATRIRAWESAQSQSAALRGSQPGTKAHVAGIAWQGRVALILGGILLASGIVLFVSAHWDQLGPGQRFSLLMAVLAVLHLGGAATRDRYRSTSTVLHAIGTVSTGAAIALVGQIFNIEEHWPAAILMWAIAALCAWMLLRDQAQQTLTLLLVPSWLICEWSYAARNHIGEDVYIGRFLFVWAILYLTYFIGTERRIVRGVLFTLSAIASVTAVFLMNESWHSWSSLQALPSLNTRAWGWIMIAAIPLIVSLSRRPKNQGSPATSPGRWPVSTVPVLAAIAFVIALPWCRRLLVEHFDNGNVHTSWTHAEPNLAAHALVAAFCVFLIGWGVRELSRGLVNLGIVGFGASVAWFYFSSLFDQMGRSLGLIGLGILFLAGGWALEKTRRSLLTHMAHSNVPAEDSL